MDFRRLSGILLLVVLMGCEDFGSVSTNPAYGLSFSVDTLSFDTVFSDVGSATKHLMAYNPHAEALRIESIALANAGKSGFRINVDGRKGDTFYDIDIWKKDSLYISVEVTLTPNGDVQPLLFEDSILFVTNGRRQSVLLQASGQDVRLLRGGVTLTGDTTLTAELPYLLYDSLLVAEGATVTLAKGVAFHMHANASIIVAGTLRAEGTREAPVVFRGDRLDALHADVILPYDRIPGQWRGIVFTPSSFNNVLEHTIVRNAINGLTFRPSDPERLKAVINHSQVTNMDGYLLDAVNCRIEASNSEFTNATDAVLSLAGGSYRFVHCTMANYKRINGRDSRTPCVVLANMRTEDDVEMPAPLRQAWFDNCIVDGSYSADSTLLYRGELLFVTGDKKDVEGNESTFNYRFRSCFIKTARVENERFVGNLFIYSPSYLKTGLKEEEYAYDFRLANESKGIGRADPTIAAQYPEDRYGVSRLTGETAPSVGAYEYVYQEEEK